MEELPRSSPKAPAVSVPVSVPVQSITVSAAPTTVTVSAPPVTVPVLLPCLPLLLLLPVCFSCYCYRTCSCFMISYRFFCYCYRICSRYSYCACSHLSFVEPVAPSTASSDRDFPTFSGDQYTVDCRSRDYIKKGITKGLIKMS